MAQSSEMSQSKVVSKYRIPLYLFVLYLFVEGQMRI